jgi:hypothetical protein
LDDVKKFAFEGNNSMSQEAEDEPGGKGSRFKIKNGTDWTLESNDTVLRYTAATYLAKVSAAVGSKQLSCVGDAAGNAMRVWLTATDCH